MFFLSEWTLLVVRCLRSLGPMATTDTAWKNQREQLEAIRKTLESA
jgi:hypothetical protein